MIAAVHYERDRVSYSGLLELLIQYIEFHDSPPPAFSPLLSVTAALCLLPGVTMDLPAPLNRVVLSKAYEAKHKYCAAQHDH